MTIELTMLVYATILCWVAIMTGAFLGTKLYTPEGVKAGLQNRDNVPKATGMAGRADRAAKNLIENLPLFAALVLVAHAAEVHTPSTVLGAQLFFYARIAHFIIYLAGIPVVRTLAYGVGVAGMAMIALALF